MKGSEHKNKFLLTNREREVFELLVQDKTTKDIAQQLFISEKTVRNHISNVVGYETHNSLKKQPLIFSLCIVDARDIHT
ncbi:LuxR C-terminal-related transcriptional regulator [Paenibacillus sp. KN14-4R]|uniref:LuxR C-terminal-related transcriptional regulator n=1 Tax=Paenibacillus sp. KN14-4R TaxID=3445773 RepID=UPI003FA1032C